MLSEATGMACKSYLLLLALIVMSVCVSGHRPLAEHHESLSPKSPLSDSGDGKLKVDTDHTVPQPSPDHGGKLKVDGSPPNDASGNHPSPNSNGGGGKLRFDSAPTGSLGAIGLIPGISLVPGGDGSFHFSLGPIDFGGNIGWGGVAPGYAVAYSQPQPYIVVSPYSTVYGQPAPVSVYGQPAPVSGYGQPAPVPGYDQPAPVSGYDQPAPVSGYGQPAPVIAYSQPTPVSGYGQPSPVSGYGQPSSSPNPSAPPVTGFGQPSQGYYSPNGNEPSSPQH